MALPVINTRDDLDAIVGTPGHDEFLAVLRGSLWRLQKDDQAQAWVAVEDNATIERFGFVRADFPNVTPPDLPAYVPPVAEVFRCTPWQIRKALNAQGLRDSVEAAIAAATDRTLKDGWEFATEFRSGDAFVVSMGVVLGKTAAETAELIQYASTL